MKFSNLVNPSTEASYHNKIVIKLKPIINQNRYLFILRFKKVTINKEKIYRKDTIKFIGIDSNNSFIEYLFKKILDLMLNCINYLELNSRVSLKSNR